VDPARTLRAQPDPGASGFGTPRPQRHHLVQHDAIVAKEPVDLLDAALALDPGDLGVGATDRRNRHHHGVQHARHPVGE